MFVALGARSGSRKWLANANANANAGAGSSFDNGLSTTDGKMTWVNANAWAASLDVAGVTGWRLPDTIDVGNDGATYTNYYQGVDYGQNITTHSELSNMFYNVLGKVAFHDINGVQTGCGSSGAGPDYCLTNTGVFSNLPSSIYWSATDVWPGTGEAWIFNMSNGDQVYNFKGYSYSAWAVRDGDVAASVPEPSIIWLLGSGLALIGFARRKA